MWLIQRFCKRLKLRWLQPAAAQTDPWAVSLLSGPSATPGEQARKDLGVANQAFPRHQFQPPPGVGRHLPTDLLNACRHLGARMPMLAGNLVKVGN